MAILDETNNQIVQQTEKDNGKQKWSLVEVSCAAPIASLGNKATSEPDAKLKIDGALDAKVFPNPAPQQFTVVISTIGKQNIQLIVRDNLGRTIEEKKNHVANGPITLGRNYRGGVYYLEVIQGNNKIVRKVIKL